MSVLVLPLFNKFFSNQDTEPTRKEASDKIHEIVGKLLHHENLSHEDETFLDRTKGYAQGWGSYAKSFLITPSDQTNVKTINNLSRRVIAGEVSAEDALGEISHILETTPNCSARESAAVANHISTYFSNVQSFEEILTDFHDSHDQLEPTRDQLITLVERYNHFTLPSPELAGTTVSRIEISVDHGEKPRTLEVRYNNEGRLEIKDGAVAPMDVSCRQHISRAEIQEMKDLYNELADHSNYNNLALVLEFAQFVRRERTVDSSFSLEDAYEAFNPDLVTIHAKYQSGTCGVLAKRFCHELDERMGIKGQSVGSEIQNVWMTLPIPGTAKDPIKWRDLSTELRGADHTDAVVAYTDENGNQSVIKFACSMGQDVPNEIEEFIGTDEASGLDRYYDTTRYGSREHIPDQTVEEGTIAKTFLKGRFKAAMSKGNKILGVDFLRGNVYLNSSWAKKLEGIPLNAQKMASINLEDLANPEENGIYFVNGEPVTLTHREALHLMLEAVSSTFEIPEDFEENVIALAQISPEFYDHLYMEPLPMIKQHYTELQYIAKEMKALSEDSSQETRYRELQRMHFEILGAIYNKQPEQLAIAIDRMMLEFKGNNS
ncbi:hypothetical protein [Simkania sp.]|uniref:hypothetical protein n=1 Tax=Simkania sp. TaxID=34094 RepID=UPI003B51CCEF